MNIHWTSTIQEPKFTMPQTAWIDFVRQLLDECRHVRDWKITNAAGEKFLVHEAKALYESLERKQNEKQVTLNDAVRAISADIESVYRLVHAIAKKALTEEELEKLMQDADNELEDDDV